MAKEGDISLYNDVLEPFRRLVNAEPYKPGRLSSTRQTKLFPDNNTSDEGITLNEFLRKRKASLNSINTTPEKKIRLGNDSQSSTPSSPWETSRLKGELIAAKAQITKLETRINQLHTLRKEMQILFDEEKKILNEQHKRDEKSLIEIEEHLQVVRKRETELRKEFDAAIREQNDMKYKWDKQKEAFEKTIAELREKLIDGNISTNDQLSEMKKDMDELSQALEAAQDEIEMLKKEVESQTLNASKLTEVQTQFEQTQLQLTQANLKVKEYEFEREEYKDWKKQARAEQKRLAAYPDLEREIARLKTNERSLRDAINNKLLLEEQVHSLSSRLDTLQPVQRQLHDCQVQLSTTEASLREWEALAAKYGVRGSAGLARALSQAQAGEIAATSEKAAALTNLQKANEELSTANHERDMTMTKLSELQTLRKGQDNLIHRLQKRLLLVTRERDSYRQQLDCYEKELSTTLSGEGQSQGQNAILSNRVQALEKSLESYRNLVEKLETQISSISSVPNATLIDIPARLREENAQLKHDIQKLRARCKQLELQLEAPRLSDIKILHLRDNPAAAAQNTIKMDLDKALEEIKRLQAKVRSLQENPSMDVSSVTTNSAELKQLKQQIESGKIKLQRMKEEFTNSAQEYRDVCYMLLGYKIDRTGPKKYRISNMYADSADEYLTFTLHDQGIEMVHTEYSASLHELVETHLHQDNSIPVFLSALTIELFTKTTMAQTEDEQQEEADERQDVVHAIDSDSEENGDENAGSEQESAGSENASEYESEEVGESNDDIDEDEMDEEMDDEENNVEE